ncbi:DUF2059 domain-containing protein [Leeuwenhoekiella marinoflava]|uniref:DUF2059 domain-containing protein n=2 Tax=Leeuwenhoekiella marinoflava TaxID=988 RepID=A0A4Q0PR22_9FLAO|nr:DUF2059 domain-containing protein [Leeuwenhoekiella marinoflava]RXG33090.1 hypothetical protein DSL99_185 [Leeuwenhoekiella marinoflava]SHE38100.1 hypothetical protein SAMN02745246_00243 [Leeuwenhoekiella marinoflava DSM 3653]
MKKLIFTALLITSFTFTIQAQEADPYKDTLVASGSMGTFQVAIKQVFNMYKQQKPGVPDEVWGELESSFSKTSIDDLAEMLTPVYKKSLTQSDLQAIIGFYQTPIGQKFAEKTPAITQESMQVGQQWGMKLGQEVMSKLQEKGY